MRTPMILVVCSLFAAPMLAQGTDKTEKQALDREARLKQQVAREWLSLAGMCVSRGARTLALDALARADALEPEDRLRLQSLKSRAEKLEGDVEPEDPAVTKRRGAVLKNVCRLLDQMAQLEVPETDEERAEGWLWSAHELDPAGRKKRARILRKLAAAAVKNERPDRIRRIMDRVRGLDPEGLKQGRYLPAVRAQGKRSRVLISSDKHAMEAWALLPRGWSEDKKWPLLVYFHGPDQDYLKAALDLRDMMEDHPFVVLVPFIRSNHKTLEPGWIPDPGDPVADPAILEEYDVPGVKAVVAEAQRLFKTERTFAVSGFSVGTMLCYWWVFRRPQDLWAAVPTSGHFEERLARGAVKPRGAGVDVRALVGADDPRGQHRRWPQNEQAILALKRLGHKRAAFTKLEARTHGWFMADVLKLLSGLRR